MKRRLSSFATITLLILLVFSIAGCGGSAAMNAPTVAGPSSDAYRDGVFEDASGFSESMSAATPMLGTLNAKPVEPANPASGGTDLSYGKLPGDVVKGLVEAPVTRYQSSLTAGLVDDNAKFEDYLGYLSTYQGPMVLPIPVQQRLFVRVVDGEQRPVAGARVQIFDGERAVFDGRTVSDGRVLFLPQTANVAQAQQFRAIISRGQHQIEATLKPGALDETVALTNIQDNSGAVSLDLVFLLDATGSMGDELDQIKATVDSVAARIEQLPGSSQPRFGLVAYQDEGDSYVTKAWEFASVQEFSQNLSNVQALGGGDYPEAVNAGLRDAINLQGWADNSTGRRLRMIVLVGDAPPHLDYANDPAYTGLLEKAVAKGIKIFPIGASGLDDQGEYIFRQFAQVTQGQFVFLTYANGVSGAPGMATNHSVSDFTVQNLDTLVVNLVAGEVANQTGERSQSYKPEVMSMVGPVPPAAKDLLGSILGALRSFTDSLASWSWLFALGIIVAWMRRPAQRARLAAFLPGRQRALAQADDILIPEITLEKTAAYFAPQRATNARLHVDLDAHSSSTMEGEQRTIPLRSLPPDIAATIARANQA